MRLKGETNVAIVLSATFQPVSACGWNHSYYQNDTSG
jgi:hypothetical protein